MEKLYYQNEQEKHKGNLLREEQALYEIVKDVLKAVVLEQNLMDFVCEENGFVSLIELSKFNFFFFIWCRS